MARPLITVIGSLNMDLVTRVDRAPDAGETLLTRSYDTGCGGKGANQAVACARLSRRGVGGDEEDASIAVDVEMIGAVGEDGFGEELVSSLSQNGVGAAGVRVVKGEKSGVAMIVVEEGTGDNRILVSPNANFALQPEDFAGFGAASGESAGAGRVPDLLVLQLEIPLPTTMAILEAAHANGIPVLLNPAPAQLLSPAAYEAVTHLVVNEIEAAIITGTAYAPDGEGISKATLEALVALGVHHTIITMGSKGVLYVDTHEALVYVLAAEKVQVKDTTAAGDTFVGAYATAVVTAREHTTTTLNSNSSSITSPTASNSNSNNSKGNSKSSRSSTAVSFSTVSEAIKHANHAASLTVQAHGAQNSIPWRRQLSQLPQTVPPALPARVTTISLAAWLASPPS